MNLRFVETFLWIVRLGSFSAAAEKLNTTQASISNRIATLERELGVQLFDRDMRTVKLTPVGQQAVSKAEEIVRAVGEFRETIADPTSLKGSVSIGTIDSIVHSFLPRLVERVQERYPGIAIDLNVDTSLNMAREIIERKIDLALIMGPALDHGLVNINLGTYGCVWVASPKYGLACKKLTLADLVSYPLLAFSKGSVPHHGLLQQFREAGLEVPAISNSNSLATIMRLAKDGLGVAPLPRVILGEYIDAGALEILDVTPAFRPLTFHAVYADHPDSLLPSIIAQMAAEVSLCMADD
ncbi:LysR family transcriptional regulator [Rhizobium sullae]|uniref:HTH-type transcriptional regulator TtuA n=1 Tax=Rhizobium sullae TaxID=50338 RepID=A0A2N0DDF9_RHISU|nr:LysR family transcriptional regulator [Rhizobium sullae]PKA44139.1 LysR family transcriptional regulator [Rhizobium sullae]UWU14376.1 LysR family transcriptional regulator [Rhizobium sullae]